MEEKKNWVKEYMDYTGERVLQDLVKHLKKDIAEFNDLPEDQRNYTKLTLSPTQDKQGRYSLLSEKDAHRKRHYFLRAFVKQVMVGRDPELQDPLLTMIVGWDNEAWQPCVHIKITKKDPYIILPEDIWRVSQQLLIPLLNPVAPQ